MTNNVDPNVGNRNWTKFVLIENGKVSRISDAPLSFRTSTGQRPTDEWLVEDGYRGYVDNGPPNHDRYKQKIVKTPLSELTIDKNNLVTQTYTVVALTSSELAEMDTRIKDEINIERDSRINSGCNVTISGVGVISIKGGEEDTRNLTNLGQLANLFLNTNDNTLITYRDNKNIIYKLTPAQMSELWKKTVYYVTSVYQASWNMKDMSPLPTDYTKDSYWPSKNV